MVLTELRIDRLRNLRDIALELDPRLNLITGSNGAGKSSIIEAIHLLSHGRSFRSAQADALIQLGTERFELFAQGIDDHGRRQALGVARSRQGWILRHNGLPVTGLAEFVRHLAAVTIEAANQELVTGPAERRRRFLDWVLFHVEPGFLDQWRRYLRALKQRNAALQRRADDSELAVWEGELAISGEVIDVSRKKLVERLLPLVRNDLATFMPELIPLSCHYRPGWPAEFQDLAAALVDGRRGDRERGFTGRGPHRGDWRLQFPNGLGHGELSRGQTKLVALACSLALARAYQGQTGYWPIVLFDDLAAELDQPHQQAVLTWLRDSGAQVFVSGTDIPAAWTPSLPADYARFHVEQGQASRLL